jgi:hypothetical protein
MLDHLFVDSERARLFLANQSNDTLDIIDLRTRQLSKQILGQTTMHGVVYVPDLGRIFVGNEDKEGSCTVIDAASYAVLKSMPAKGADSVRYDPRRSRTYVVSENSLTVINAKSLELVTTIRLPGSPYGFQVAKTKDRIYVNVSSPLQVAVVDAAKNEVVDHFSLEGGSKGIGPLALDEANSRILLGFGETPAWRYWISTRAKKLRPVRSPRAPTTCSSTPNQSSFTFRVTLDSSRSFDKSMLTTMHRSGPSKRPRAPRPRSTIRP